uniref:Uncharacterized protein n=1 Tax=Pipistrellus kuhlii TaxID=59472 RepID=A0A7J7R2C3_PIPKU|nr:hypothetical protein mPipKuh1_007993 [Pipistrellus kuhlii]
MSPLLGARSLTAGLHLSRGRETDVLSLCKRPLPAVLALMLGPAASGSASASPCPQHCRVRGGEGGLCVREPATAPETGSSTGRDCGVQEQRIFSNHQRLAPMTVTSTPPWSGAPAYLLHHPAICSTLCCLLPMLAMFCALSLVVSTCHSNQLFGCSAI